MTKQEMIDELKELDAELDRIHARRTKLRKEFIERFGLTAWNKLFDLFHWTF